MQYLLRGVIPVKALGLREPGGDQGGPAVGVE